MNYEEIITLLGDEAESLLSHTCEKIPKDLIISPGPESVLTVLRDSNRSSRVIANLQRLYHHGRLAGTGYLSIFPVDQGLEHTAAYSFYQQPRYFDPQAILEMAIAGGCSGVASTFGVLSLVSKKYQSKIPFIVKINHSEHLTLPELTDQLIFTSVDQAATLGAAAIGATVYFGSNTSHKQIEQISRLFERAHQLGMATILWCYPRNDHYKKDDQSYEEAVDVTAQAIHLGVSMGADIVKQKMPTPLRAFQALNFSKYDEQMYDQLLTDHPIDLVRYQVLHAYSGRIGLINSGGESLGEDNLRAAVRQAVINKRAGGHGLIMGRKVFKSDWDTGVKLLQAVQNVYLEPKITIA